jgi:predicted MFS family arabinose efflux permease
MTGAERRATAGLAAIFGLRMLGLFLVLPVFTLYGGELEGATPMLIGLAIGAYGFTQALLQIPMGYLSDRIGRRPVIFGGLLLFAAGSVVAALAESIELVILGRALQGCGAIAAAVMALAADLTRPQQRTKAMAVIGISIGGAFLTALIAGPLLAAGFGLAGVFWFTGGFAVLAMVLLFAVVPAGGAGGDSAGALTGVRRGELGRVLRDPDLLRLDFGILVLHLVLTASFVVLPVVLTQWLGTPRADHWQVYVPVLLLSVLAMAPVIAVGERRRKMHRVLGAVVFALLLAVLAIAATHGLRWGLLAALWLFFAAFNILEATLPSLVSRFAPGEARGTALGVYSTAQFIGAFLGGVLGGAVYGAFGIDGVFVGCAAMVGLWFVVALGLRAPEEVPGAGAYR